MKTKTIQVRRITDPNVQICGLAVSVDMAENLFRFNEYSVNADGKYYHLRVKEVPIEADLLFYYSEEERIRISKAAIREAVAQHFPEKKSIYWEDGCLF